MFLPRCRERKKSRDDKVKYENFKTIKIKKNNKINEFEISFLKFTLLTLSQSRETKKIL